MDRRALRITFFAAFCILLTSFAWLGVRWIQKLPARIATTILEGLESKAREMRQKFYHIAGFEPKIRVNETIISDTTSRIAEVTVLEKKIEVVREFTHTWAGSSKKLRLSGSYSVKTGFNLLQRFEIQVEKGSYRILLPPPAILSVEQTTLKVEALENGFWNSISASDLENSIAALKETARNRALPLLPLTEQEFMTRLHSVMDAKVEIVPALP